MKETKLHEKKEKMAGKMKNSKKGDWRKGNIETGGKSVKGFEKYTG